nr:glycosyltransferase family 9 protein [Pantoea cypripedii]
MVSNVKNKKILVICRDNIGDSLLATPLIKQLSRSNEGRIDILTNSYASPIFDGNPYIGKVWIYSKTKHCQNRFSALKSLWDRARLCLALNREKYDCVVIAKSLWDKHSLKWAKIIRAKEIVAFGNDRHPRITKLLPVQDSKLHVAEVFFNLAKGVYADAQEPEELDIYPKTELVDHYRRVINNQDNQMLIAIQISSRKKCQRWPLESFISLVKKIADRTPFRIVLLWSPGEESSLTHPGDNIKAEMITSACKDVNLTPVYTDSLEDLKAVLANCHAMVSSDGGAVHIGAASGLPVVAMYGNSDPANWHPWKVPHCILQGIDNNVSNITSEQVFTSLISLLPVIPELKNYTSPERQSLSGPDFMATEKFQRSGV